MQYKENRFAKALKVNESERIGFRINYILSIRLAGKKKREVQYFDQ